MSKFPKTYLKKITTGDCWIVSKFKYEHPTFLENPEGYDMSTFIEYFWKSEERFMLPWSECDEIFIPMNIENIHWILVVINLQECRAEVYDCDPALYKKINVFMKPICQMIPYLFHKAMSEEEKKLRYHNLSLNPLPFRRIKIPKATVSGDCGVFMIMYMEYLAANLGLQDVTSEHVPFWREKWAVRLFHQLIDI